MILLAFGLGLLAGVMIGGYWIARRIYIRQLEFPEWINDGGAER